MPTYRLLVEYDGTDFHGWQTQPNGRTVQGEIERALGLITREEVRTAGAGRTDAGVHAKGQVVTFRLECAVDRDRLRAGIEGICGDELRVRRCDDAPERFHARHDARWRAYSYRLLEERSARWRRLAWFPRAMPSLAILRRTSGPVLGEHDFSSFANLTRDQGSPICTVLDLDWNCWTEGLVLRIRADHFLYKMVRNLVGTLVRESLPDGGGAAAIEEILAGRNRRLAAPPAPASGLCFDAVGYDPPWPDWLEDPSAGRS